MGLLSALSLVAVRVLSLFDLAGLPFVASPGPFLLDLVPPLFFVLIAAVLKTELNHTVDIAVPCPPEQLLLMQIATTFKIYDGVSYHLKRFQSNIENKEHTSIHRTTALELPRRRKRQKRVLGMVTL